MNDRITLFINNLDRELIRLPKGNRRDIVSSIENHIHKEMATGRDVDEIIGELGSPQTLAKGYIAQYLYQSPPSLTRFFVMAGFFAGTGFISLIVVPTLGSLMIGFGVSTIICPLVGLFKIFYPNNTHISLYTFGHEGSEWVLLSTLGLGLVFGLLTYLCKKLLGLYFRLIMRGYRHLTPQAKSSTLP
ncbi:DUF1700 domain-containing protein [Brevibacillus ginsengisoli]|uniref:DUF1700 domain-containing protein n=1 Tax=Brevibacillus ginsengisoli TaxID=363854 RepID=UPI003CE844EA